MSEKRTFDDERLDIEEYTIEDGEIRAKTNCKHTGLPLTRVTDLGMFCASEDCVCEREAKDTFEMIKDLFGKDVSS